MAARGRGGGASAGATLARVVREAPGWPAGLTVLTGGDLYHLDKAQRALIEALVPAADADFGLTVFGDQRVDVSTVVAAARSAGMFAERRVVLVRDLGSLEGEPDALKAYAGDPPRSSYLIVRAPDLDRRRKLHQALAKAPQLLAFEAVDPRDAGRTSGEVTALAREKGLAIERRAAAVLAEICAGDYYRVDTELEKLRSWAGGAADRPITVQVLREIASGSASLTGWEVASALLHADKPAALSALVRLLDAGDEPLRMLGGIAYRARSMVQARLMMERGVPAQRAVAAARIWGEPPARAASGLARYSVERVMRFPSLLLQADRTLKSRAIAPRAVLEAMLEQMIPDAAPPRRSSR